MPIVTIFTVFGFAVVVAAAYRRYKIAVLRPDPTSIPIPTSIRTKKPSPLSGLFLFSGKNGNATTAAGGKSEALTFATAQTSFGLYWGSIDAYNEIQFLLGNNSVAAY